MAVCTAGLDVHARSVRISVVRADELVGEVTVPYNAGRIAEQLQRLGAERCCYEAGPTGVDLYRKLRSRGIDCTVIAPALVPRRAGDRVKTDKRDARQLALLFQAGLLTPVRVLDADLEALRDLLRARDDARLDRNRSRQRISKFCLRYGRRLPTSSWTKQRRIWLGQQAFERAAQQRAFDDYLESLDIADRRLERLDVDVLEYAQDPTIAALVGRLRCLRGIDTLSALILIAEIGDFARFPSAPAFMSYVGLVPCESSSGEQRSQGGLTKTGNSHVRRILIEAAWNNRQSPRISATMAARHQGQSPRVVQHAAKCQRRLHKRWSRMGMRNKPANKIVAAVARELAGFVWAIAVCTD